ncbi:MAG: radical SAM protein [Polyangiaceae bacterium]|nr:radical SAM protein [Polyangiaceae bacterium]
MKLSVVLTHACNLACSYCYTGEKKAVRMAPETAFAALDWGLARSRADGWLWLGFFGGEPLVEWELLARLAERARELAARQGLELVLQCTTNGTLLDPERVARLHALGVRLALSLDGTAEHHDLARRTAGGGASHGDVLRALELLVAARRPFEVVTVVTPATAGMVSQSLRYLFDRGVERVTLNTHWGGAWTDAELDTYRREWEVAAAVFVAWMRRGRAVSLEPLDSALVGVARGRRGPVERCLAGTSSVAVAPSGRLYGCARSVGEDDGRLAIGDLERGIVPALAARAAGSAAAPDECRGCAAAERCDRHCACACLEETGDAGTPGPVLCFQQHVLEDLARRVWQTLVRERCPAFLERFGGELEARAPEPAPEREAAR